MQPSSKPDNGDNDRDYMEEVIMGLLVSFIFDSTQQNGKNNIQNINNAVIPMIHLGIKLLF